MDGFELWNQYWVWFALALGLGILEILVPGYILLGFAIAAAIVGIILVIGGSGLTGSLSLTLAVYGALSLIVWLILRFTFGRPKGQVKVWEDDINDR